MPYTEISAKMITTVRRERVASLRLRGLTEHEITTALADARHGPVIVNPKTGLPYNQSTIHRDLKALEKDWREASRKSTGERIARQLRELEELKRAAWAKGNLAMVARALADERAILGWDGNMDLMQLWRDELGADVTEAEIGELMNEYIKHIKQHQTSRTS